MPRKTYREYIDGKADELIDKIGGIITPPPTNHELYRDFVNRKFNDVINGLDNVVTVGIATGNPVSFNTSLSMPLVKCISDISGYQEGTGTPTPDNVRNLVSFDECNITNKGNTYTLSFGKSIYEGTIDFTTGVLTATKVAKVFNGSENWGLHPGIANWFWVDGQLEDAYISATSADFANSNMYVQRRYDEASVLSEGQFAIGIPSSGAPVRLAVKDTNQATVSDFKTFLNSNNLQIAYTLASPLEIQLTPTQIQTIIGQNNIISNTGNLDIKYLK